MTEKTIDILGLGCIAIDDVLCVKAYPQPDTKVRIQHRFRQCGGITATALIAAARLGCRSAYAGNLGQSDLTREALAHLQSYGVNIDHVRIQGEGNPAYTTIIVDQTNHTRTIFSDLNRSIGATTDHPSESVFLSARVLLVDHFGIEGMTRATQIARQANIPVVADLERCEWPGFAELLAMIDHPILSLRLAREHTDLTTPEQIIDKLWHDDRQIVVITDGENGCWYRSIENERIHHFPAFQVDVVDTTGCGDVFHGAYCAALLQDNLKVEERIRFATAAAGIKATRQGGPPAAPSLEEVKHFLNSR